MAIRNVALVGANGNLGAPILEALTKSGAFDVTVLKRASSKSHPLSGGPSVHIAEVDNDMTFESLYTALKGQDAAIACFPLKDTSQHLCLADAAAAAGVKRFIPADYGSCDSSSKQAQDLVPLFLNKVRVRERLQEHAAKDDNFSWTSLVAGHFFDWGLRENFLHFDLKTRTADVVDDGTYRSSTSTLARIAHAVVKVLQMPEETRNKMLFIQSFCVSQLDLLKSLEKATGAKWKVNWVKSDEFTRENKAKADAGDKEAFEHLVFVLGIVDGDWEKKDGFAMKLLGLENEDLDEVVAKVVADESEMTSAHREN